MILLFDLDGTLTDPREGIVGSTRHAFERMGLEPPAEDLVATFIGPPLRGMFATLLGDADPGRIEEAVLHYRDRYRDVGIFETAMYPGVPEMLERARALASRVYLATSKPWTFAERILDHLALGTYFDGVHGPELDGRFDDKAVLIARMLEREGFAPESAVMIGDRAADVIAARSNRLEPIGVLWGYGSEKELVAAGARTVCANPVALVRALEVRAGGPGTTGAGPKLSPGAAPAERAVLVSGGEGSGFTAMPYLRRIRSMVGHELLLLPSVTVLVFDPDDRLLLLKHTNTGRWIAPGGMVEPDESPEQAAVREMREEIGCDVRLLDTIGVFGGPKFRVRYDNGDEVAYVMTVYTAQIEEGVPSGSSAEAEEMRFVSRRELAALDTAEWLKEVLSHVGWAESRVT
jgi:phosphoglycolate phosphatase